MQVSKLPWVHHGGGSINSVDVQPGNTRFATGGADGKVKWWLVAPLSDESLCTPELTAPLYVGTHHEGAINVVRWASHGHWLASGSDDHSVIIWQAKRMDIFGAPTLLSASSAYTEHWTPVCLLKGHDLEVQDVSWAPGDRYLASASFDNTIRIWALNFLHQEDTSSDGAPPSAKRPRLEQTRSTGAPGSASRLVGVCLSTLKSHTSWAQAVCWDPFGRLLASFGDDKTLCLWAADAVSAQPSSRGLPSLNNSDNPYASLQCVQKVNECFKELPGSSAVCRVSWAPDGSCLSSCAGIQPTDAPKDDADANESLVSPLFTTPVIARGTLDPALFLTGTSRPTVLSRFCPSFLYTGDAEQDGVVYSPLATASKDGNLTLWAAPHISRAPLLVFDKVCDAPISDVAWGALIPTPSIGTSAREAQTVSGYFPFVLLTGLDGSIIACSFAEASSSPAGSNGTLGRFATIDDSVLNLCGLHDVNIADVQTELEKMLHEMSQVCRKTQHLSKLEQRLLAYEAIKMLQLSMETADKPVAVPTPQSAEASTLASELLIPFTSAASANAVNGAAAVPAAAGGLIADADVHKRIAASVCAKDIAFWVLCAVAYTGEPSALLEGRWGALSAGANDACFALPACPDVLLNQYEAEHEAFAAETSLLPPQEPLQPVSVVSEVEAVQREERVKGKRRIAPVLASSLPSPTRVMPLRTPSATVDVTEMEPQPKKLFSPLDEILAAAQKSTAVEITPMFSPPTPKPVTSFGKPLKVDQVRLAKAAAASTSNSARVVWLPPSYVALQQRLNQKDARAWLQTFRRQKYPGNNGGEMSAASLHLVGELQTLSRAVHDLVSSVGDLIHEIRNDRLVDRERVSHDLTAVPPYICVPISYTAASFIASKHSSPDPYDSSAGDGAFLLVTNSQTAPSCSLQYVRNQSLQWLTQLNSSAVSLCPLGVDGIAVGSIDGTIVCVSQATGNVITRPTYVGDTPVVALAANADRLATITKAGEMRIFKVSDEEGLVDLVCSTSLQLITAHFATRTGIDRHEVRLTGLFLESDTLDVTVATPFPRNAESKHEAGNFRYNMRLSSWQM